MRSTGLLPLLLCACVVKYGAPDAAPRSAGVAPAAPASSMTPDFAGLEARIDALLNNAVEVDDRDRLLAALDLARASHRLGPDAQAVNFAFLSTLVTIEERDVPYAAPALAGGSGSAAPRPADEDRLHDVVPLDDPIEPGPDPLPPVVDPPVPPATAQAPSPAPSADALLGVARQKLSAGDAASAMATLEPCRGQPCWDAVRSTWEESRDALVFQQREDAGARYIAARQIADPAQRAEALRQVKATLSALLEQYPDSRYADALRKNLQLVDHDLDALSKP